MAAEPLKSVLDSKNLKLGFATAIISQPFEVLRTSMIVSKYKSNNINVRGLYEVCVSIKNQEGFRGFFRGTQIAVVKNTFQTLLFFSGIDSISKKTKQSLPLESYSLFTLSAINFLTACCSKFMTTTVVNPLIIIKTNLEVIGQQRYTGAIQCTRQIYQESGILGFQKGLIPTLCRDVPWSGTQYSIYKGMLLGFDTIYENPTQHSWIVMVCAGTSSMAAIMLTYPFDNLRVRSQTAGNDRQGIYSIASQVYNSEGINGFYKGYLPRILKKGCTGTVLWTLYEKFSNNAKQMQQ